MAPAKTRFTLTPGATSRTGSPAVRAAPTPSPPVATSTSWPASRNAAASGTSGSTCPTIGDATNRARMRLRLAGTARFRQGLPSRCVDLRAGAVPDGVHGQDGGHQVQMGPLPDQPDPHRRTGRERAARGRPWRGVPEGRRPPGPGRISGTSARTARSAILRPRFTGQRLGCWRTGRVGGEVAADLTQQPDEVVVAPPLDDPAVRTRRYTSVPPHRTALPVAGTPASGPEWVPVAVHRAATQVALADRAGRPRCAGPERLPRIRSTDSAELRRCPSESGPDPGVPGCTRTSSPTNRSSRSAR